MSKLTVGRRVYPDVDGNLHLGPCDYGRGADEVWTCRPPGCHAGCLSAHEVTEHEDGTATASPSILLKEPSMAEWHGYLEWGVWREC